VAEIMASIKQKKALNNLVANGGNKAQAIRDAGYAESMTREPAKVFDSVGLKPEVERFVAKLEKERERLLDSIMSKNLDDVQYESAIRSVDILTKNTQLLGGKATDNVAVSVTGFNLNINNGEDRI
jgi:IS5 family transposase